MGQDGKAESVQVISLEEVRRQQVRYGDLTLSGMGDYTAWWAKCAVYYQDTANHVLQREQNCEKK